jgi:translation initiation factor 5
MPAVQIKIEGRGKKTVVSNLTEIARALNRREEEILKFISYEAGTQTKVKNDKMTINKAMMPNDLQNIIYDYIERFVLCSDCDNPETYYKFKLKKDRVYRKCKACGGKNRIKNEKLNKYLLKKEENRPPTPPQPNFEKPCFIRTTYKK